MDKIISKTIEIKAQKLPPDVEFIENEINSKINGEIIRWAIVDVKDNLLKVSASCKISS